MELTKRIRISIGHPDAIFIKLLGTGSLRGFLWGEKLSLPNIWPVESGEIITASKKISH